MNTHTEIYTLKNPIFRFVASLVLISLLLSPIIGIALSTPLPTQLAVLDPLDGNRVDQAAAGSHHIVNPAGYAWSDSYARTNGYAWSDSYTR